MFFYLKLRIKSIIHFEKLRLAFISLYYSVLTFSFLSFLAFTNIKENRDAVIVEVPIEAFNEQGTLVDKSWKEYLSNNRPIGVIFFKEHLANRNFAKNVINSVKLAVGDDVFLSADIEGGRVNRMQWYNDILSAGEMASDYLDLKERAGEQVAKEWIIEEYDRLFGEMNSVGLNMTFAPNLDLNKYYAMNKKRPEYKYYKKTEMLIKMLNKKKENLKENDLKRYEKARFFIAFLDEIGVRSLDLFNYNGKLDKINKKIRDDWQSLKDYERDKYKSEFSKLIDYYNYASVVGDRSFSGNPYIVAEIADIFVKTAQKHGIECVAKHALGHGRASGDTHIAKQQVDVSEDILEADIYPYKKIINNIKFVMPAHIVYSAIDSENTAIKSEKVLNWFKEKVGDVSFITDDIVMEGSETENNEIDTPCDIVLISHKSLHEVKEIAKNKKVNRDVYSKWFKKIKEFENKNDF